MYAKKDVRRKLKNKKRSLKIWKKRSKQNVICERMLIIFYTFRHEGADQLSISL